ncbi:hypothetical protein [Nguyenibacter vanlangensis]|nr:hypothetical protein [Nguyenibacter vanlangensis]
MTENQTTRRKAMIRSVVVFLVAPVAASVPWINSLRDAIREFQSYGVTPGISQNTERKFYELGTRIASEKYSVNPHFLDI